MSSTLPDAPLIALTMIALATSLSVLSNGKGAFQIIVAVVEQHQNGHGGRDQRGHSADPPLLPTTIILNYVDYLTQLPSRSFD